MTAEWTAPITWEVDQLVTADNLNQQIRDNQEYLLSPNHQRILRDNSGTYTITNVTSFQDIDSTNLSIDLETHGGPVWVHFHAVAFGNGTAINSFFDIAVDGTRVGNAFTLGLATFNTYNNAIRHPLTISILLTGLAAATYTIRPQWRTDPSDYVTLLANSSDNPVIFEAIEL
jgi:hypothetical protein